MTNNIANNQRYFLIISISYFIFLAAIQLFIMSIERKFDFFVKSQDTFCGKLKIKPTHFPVVFEHFLFFQFLTRPPNGPSSGIYFYFKYLCDYKPNIGLKQLNRFLLTSNALRKSKYGPKT